MPATTEQIRAAFDRVNAIWKANDGAGLGRCFVEDGTLINPFGERADGRDAVAAMYTQYFAGMLAGSTSATDLKSVRQVGADHAFADAEQTVYAPDGGVLLAVHLSVLLRKVGDSWLFVDSRPYVFAQPPV